MDTVIQDLKKKLETDAHNLKVLEFVNDWVKNYLITQNMSCKQFQATRKKGVIRVKFALIYILYSNTSKKIGTKFIAGLFGKKNHTTVLHAITQVKDSIELENSNQSLLNWFNIVNYSFEVKLK